MVRTPEACQICSSLKEDNSRLGHLVEELRELMSEVAPVRRHLEMAVTALFEVITQQFDREQRGHLFQHLGQLDPALAEYAECRHNEHLQLVKEMETIRAAFDRRRDQRSDEVDAYLGILLERFLEAWNEHERKEDQLVHEALFAEARGLHPEVQREGSGCRLVRNVEAYGV